MRIFQESMKFTELGYRILIACRHGSQISRHAEKAGLSVFNVRMRFACDPIAITKLLQIIRAENVDIVHTHSSKDSWIAGAAGRISGIPVVRSRHLSTPVKQSWSTKIIYGYLADIIISSSKHIKETLIIRNKITPDKIVSVPAGVDIEKYDINISGDKIYEELGLKDAYPVVGIVSILRHWKGHRYLLEAALKVISIYPKARFLIVGNGPQWDNLQRQVRTLRIEKNVIMTGFRDDIPRIMAALDIFVLLSYASEGTSQVIPQALAMGKPVIAANVGGLPEIIEDGVTGLLVAPKDHEAVSDAILWLAEHREKAREMALRGRDKIVKNYTFQGMIDQTEKGYHRVLKKWGRQAKV